jgi:hypothetical protein
MSEQVIAANISASALETLKSLTLPNASSSTRLKNNFSHKKKPRSSSVRHIPNQRHNTDWFHITWDYINSCNANPSTKRAILIRAATDFNADFTAPQLAKLVSCDPSVIYKDMKSFITAGILKIKVEGSYDKRIATIYELIPYNKKKPAILKGLTRTLLESRNKIFFKEFNKAFSVI